MSEPIKRGDVVTWTVAACPSPPPLTPGDAPVVAHNFTRRGRMLDVMPGGVLADPLSIDAYPESDRMKEYYVSLQPGGLALLWLCEGQYQRAAPGTELAPG